MLKDDEKILTLIIFLGIMQTTFGQLTTEKEKSLQRILDKRVDGIKVFGTSFAIKKDRLVWKGASVIGRGQQINI
jgi:hypothetical protein